MTAAMQIDSAHRLRDHDLELNIRRMNCVAPRIHVVHGFVHAGNNMRVIQIGMRETAEVRPRCKHCGCRCHISLATLE